MFVDEAADRGATFHQHNAFTPTVHGDGRAAQTIGTAAEVGASEGRAVAFAETAYRRQDAGPASNRTMTV